MTTVGQNMQYAYTVIIEGILEFKTFEGFKQEVAYKTANNNKFCNNIINSLPAIVFTLSSYLDLRDRIYQETGENCIRSSSVICTHH
jgi:hypothetical protein